MRRFPRWTRSALAVAAVTLTGTWSAGSDAGPQRPLTFTERVAAQETILRFYHAHQLGDDRTFEEAVPRPAIEERVRETLRLSEKVERERSRSITRDELQRELDRIESATGMPGRLRELYAALDHDPLSILEGVARPALVRRLSQTTIERTRLVDVAERFEKGGTLPADDFVWDNGILDDPSAPGTPPAPLAQHTAVWTGTEMIVWGGPFDCSQLPSCLVPGTGGRYDPLLDAWTPTSTSGAPSLRHRHSAVWTGSEMIVFGGLREGPSGPQEYNTGGHYDPLLDSWTYIGGEGWGRYDHTAVWTGSEMIIFGGSYFDSGLNAERHLDDTRIYDPASAEWTTVPIGPNTPSARGEHTAVWTGTEMLVWGGRFRSVHLASGARFEPTENQEWVTLPTVNAPEARSRATAVWTGDKMIIWGGSDSSDYKNDGAMFDPSTSGWTPIATVGTPSGREDHTAVWTGTEMIVWGGTDAGSSWTDTGGRFDPAANAWIADTPTLDAPGPQTLHSAVWTGNEMLVVGRSPRPGGRLRPGDLDQDGWDNFTDNCPTVPNPGQEDQDADGIGDACDNCVLIPGDDADEDGLCGAEDNCPDTPNPDQADQDVDGVGDLCDSCPADPVQDEDADGLCGTDNCPLIFNPTQDDADGDGSGDVCDVCPNAPTDDADADHTCDDLDNCPNVWNPSQNDTDEDGIGNACDVCNGDPDNDIDGDGFCCDPGISSFDNCCGVANSQQLDGDGDDRGDVCDPCPTIPAGGPNTDLDGTDNACDCDPLDPEDQTPWFDRGVQLTFGETEAGVKFMAWASGVGVDSVSITRGLISNLSFDQYGSCWRSGRTVRSVPDHELPPSGDGFTYLIQGDNVGCGLTGLGPRSDESLRINVDPGACVPGTIVDARPISHQSIRGTVNGSLDDVMNSDDVFLELREVISGGPPQQRYSELEHRFVIAIPPGNAIEFHVEGGRFNISGDGDQFAFEYLDGNDWIPIPIQPPLNGGGPDPEDPDSVGSLPSTLSGEVEFRVIDTNHAGGAILFDSVRIDEIFVRSNSGG